MPEHTEHLLQTRRSLLERLRDADDRTGWQEFFDTYWRLLYHVAVRSGLNDAEAQDAVQETTIALAKYMPQFKYDPGRCTFKSWLMLLMRQRIVHQIRKRDKTANSASASSAASVTVPGENARDCAVEPQLEAIWNEEWEKHVLARALHKIKQQVSDRQFQIFDLYVLQCWPAAKIARTLRIGAAQVYLAKHRISRLLKKEIQKLQAGGV